MSIELQDREAADHFIAVGHDDALDRFISRWEPINGINRKEWRAMLKEVLEMYQPVTNPLSRKP